MQTRYSREPLPEFEVNVIRWRMEYAFVRQISGASYGNQTYNEWCGPAIHKFAEQYCCEYDEDRHMLYSSEESFVVIKLACPEAIGAVHTPLRTTFISNA